MNFIKIFENVYSYDIKFVYLELWFIYFFKFPIKEGSLRNKDEELFKNDIEMYIDKTNKKKEYNEFINIKHLKMVKYVNKFDDFVINKNNIYTRFDFLLTKNTVIPNDLLGENIYSFIKGEKSLNS